mgnify:FL=1
MGNNNTGIFEGNNLLDSIVNISKAGEYDVLVQQVKELQAENEILKNKAADLTGNTDNHVYKFLSDENMVLKQPTKVLVYVKDGTVSTISSNIGNIRIVVIDEDNIGDEKNGFISEPYEPDAVSENLYELFNDSTDPVEMEIRDELKRMKF